MFECLCPMLFNVFLSVLKVGEGSRKVEKESVRKYETVRESLEKCENV